MPSYQKRKRLDGRVSWMAWVRVRPFKPASRAFATKEAARGWAEAHERELKTQTERGMRPDVTQLTLKGLIEEYLADPDTKRLRTYGGISDLLAWWVNDFAAERVLDWNVLKVRDARQRLQKGREVATVNRYLSALRSCWNWGRAAGLVPQDRAWPSRVMLSEPKGRTRFLSDVELVDLLQAAKKHSAVMYAAIVISVGCGVRQSELLRLKWSDVDLDRQRLRVLLSKNNESRAVYLPVAVADALRALKRAPVVGQLLIIDDDGQAVDKNWIEYRWKAIRTDAKLHDFRWHDLRHSCASFLAQQGASLLEIGSVLGHKSPSATSRYSHLVEGAPVTGHTKLDEKLRGAP